VQPAAPPAPAAAAAARPVAPAVPTTLANAVEHVEATVRLASSQGITRARLTLHPAELGDVDVHLRSSAAGLTATVRADSPEAAKLLLQAAGDLRTALEEHGVNLLRLDISSADERRTGAGPARDGNTGAGSGHDAEGEEPAPEPKQTLQLRNGVLVDVLA
jgi:flagellar hook-length control protein FliK